MDGPKFDGRPIRRARVPRSEGDATL